MQTVHDMLRRAAARAPQHCALVDPVRGIRLTHAQLQQRIDAVAAHCGALGVRAQDRVGFVASNSLDAIVALLALHRAQAVPALLNPRLKAAELAELVGRGEMAAAVVGTGAAAAQALAARCPRVLLLQDLVRDGEPLGGALQALPEPQPSPDAPAFVFYTSGTTGLPKGALIPHCAAESRVLFMATQVGLRHGTHNIVLGLMPLHHVVGFFAVLVMALAFDGRYVVVEEFRPDETLRLVEQERVTALFATPTHLDALAAAAARPGAPSLHTLQHLTFAGATMPQPVLDRVNCFLPGEKVNIYGTTEAMNSLYMRSPSNGIALQPGFDSEVRVVRIGGGVDEPVAVGEEGELVIAPSDAAFSGYLNQPEATAEKLQQGWYRTSDAARREADGTVAILGRVDDMIISGGENIHPSEVERVLCTAPAVLEVAVVGVPDARWGESVVACVVSRPGQDCSAEALDALCRGSELADFKRPRRYHFLAELPKNAMNKVLRRQLVQLLSGDGAGHPRGEPT